jgi:hypothetical protein
MNAEDIPTFSSAEEARTAGYDISKDGNKSCKECYYRYETRRIYDGCDDTYLVSFDKCNKCRIATLKCSLSNMQAELQRLQTKFNEARK